MVKYSKDKLLFFILYCFIFVQFSLIKNDSSIILAHSDTHSRWSFNSWIHTFSWRQLFRLCSLLWFSVGEMQSSVTEIWSKFSLQKNTFSFQCEIVTSSCTGKYLKQTKQKRILWFKSITHNFFWLAAVVLSLLWTGVFCTQKTAQTMQNDSFLWDQIYMCFILLHSIRFMLYRCLF